uniref:Uncharacterized protein n=1 Tax=Kalanchoe fedtschenkoi TaxID=63787 RepID=A0A7N0VE72_KALFE
MMEWCCGNRVNDVGVRMDQGTWSRFPWQERWKQCGLNALESLDESSVSFTDECDLSCENLMDQLAEMDCMVGDGDDASVRGGLSESSNCWTTLLTKHDNGFPGTDQTDDVRVSGQFHLSSSPISPGTYSMVNNLTRDMLFDMDDIASCEQMDVLEFPYSLDWGKKQSDTLQHNLSDMMSSAVPQHNTLTGNVEAPPQQTCASRRVADRPSVEETVLQELGRAIDKLTDESTLCLRDALYRLASYSDKHLSGQGQHGDSLASEKPFTTALLDQSLRALQPMLWSRSVIFVTDSKDG